jgi:putative acetyltransferase
VEFAIRDATDGDAWDLVGLVAACWAEFPGVILDVHGEVPELLRIASHYTEHAGRAWVAESAGRVVGSVALAPGWDPGVAMLEKLYVAHHARRCGLGSILVGEVEREARRRGFEVVELWSDTRFTAAHALYERLGYERRRDTRRLGDISATVEYHYGRRLDEAARP